MHKVAEEVEVRAKLARALCVLVVMRFRLGLGVGVGGFFPLAQAAGVLPLERRRARVVVFVRVMVVRVVVSLCAEDAQCLLHNEERREAAEDREPVRAPLLVTG